MTKVSLIANKAMTYATRRLQAGDEFLASERDATILTYAKKAKRKRVPGAIDAPPKAVVQKVAPPSPAAVGAPPAGEHPATDGEPVVIPEGWQDLHWTARERLAAEIIGADTPLASAEGQTRAQKADAIIWAEVSERAVRGGSEGEPEDDDAEDADEDA